MRRLPSQLQELWKHLLRLSFTIVISHVVTIKEEGQLIQGRQNHFHRLFESEDGTERERSVYELNALV
jgi:biotin operon repressor